MEKLRSWGQGNGELWLGKDEKDRLFAWHKLGRSTMEEKVMSETQTLYTCGKSVRYASLMLLEDGRMVIRDEAGLQTLVNTSITPKQAEGFLRGLYLLSKERLKAEDEWNETEKENAALQDRRANFRDGEYIIFWTFVQTFLG